MNIILSILIILVFAAIALWVCWNILEVIYHTVMTAVYAVAWVFLTICEFVASLFKKNQ